MRFMLLTVNMYFDNVKYWIIMSVHNNCNRVYLVVDIIFQYVVNNSVFLMYAVQLLFFQIDLTHQKSKMNESLYILER